MKMCNMSGCGRTSSNFQVPPNVPESHETKQDHKPEQALPTVSADVFAAAAVQQINLLYKLNLIFILLIKWLMDKHNFVAI